MPSCQRLSALMRLTCFVALIHQTFCLHEAAGCAPHAAHTASSRRALAGSNWSWPPHALPAMPSCHESPDSRPPCCASRYDFSPWALWLHLPQAHSLDSGRPLEPWVSRADGLVQGELPPITPEFWPFSPALPVTLAHPLLPPKHGWLGQGQVRTVVPVPRGGHLPFFGQPGSPSFATHWRYCHADKTVPGRMLIHPSPLACATPKIKRCLHTRRFGTLASPPPPVERMPCGPHLPGHAQSWQ